MIEEHTWSFEKLSEYYSTHIDSNDLEKSKGLTSIKANKVLEEFGPNTVPPRTTSFISYISCCCKSPEAFSGMMVSVIRDGETIQLEIEKIVVGDIIRLKSGDKIPADCRIIQNSNMKVDQSMVTGESEPVESTVEAVDYKHPLESKNIIF